MSIPLRVGVGERLRSGHGKSSSDEPELTKSSILTQAQNKIKALEEENKSLHEDITELRTAYKQLLTEGSHESFDERRVNWLKSHIIQLERQVVLLQEAVGTRAELLIDVENSLSAIANCCRKHTGNEGRVGSVSIPKTDLQDIIESAESARIKLYRNIERSEIKWKPLFGMERFSNREVTLLDVCSGKTNHLNLNQVARLESQLAQLYKQLLLLCKSLHVIASTPNQPTNHDKGMGKSGQSSNHHVPKAVCERLLGQVAKSCNLLEDASSRLLELTILVPSAPWPALRKPALKELTIDNVMDKLPTIPRSKVRETRDVVDGLVKAINYTVHMAKAESGQARKEAEFHREIYSTQHQYVQGLIDAIRLGYSSFEEEVNSVLCDPLRDIMRVFDTLRETASEEALREFLAAFKRNADQIEDAIQHLETNQEGSKERRESLSEYGEQYMASINTLCLQHQIKRDEILNNLDVVRKHRAAHLEDISKMFATNVSIEDDLLDTSLNKPLALEKSRKEVVTKGMDKFSKDSVREERKETVEKGAGIQRENTSIYTYKIGSVQSRAQMKLGQDVVHSDDDGECTCGASHQEVLSTPKQFSHNSQLTPVDVETRPKPKSVRRNTPSTSRPPPGLAQSKLTMKPLTRTGGSLERTSGRGQSPVCGGNRTPLRRTSSSSRLVDNESFNSDSPDTKPYDLGNVDAKPWR